MSTQPTQTQRLLAIVFGIIPAAIGLNAMVQPDEHLKTINLPTPTAPSDRLSAHCLLYIFGIRQLFIGGVLSLGAARGTKSILGGLLILTGAIAAGDALVVWAMNIGGHLPSVGIASVIATTGVWVLRS